MVEQLPLKESVVGSNPPDPHFVGKITPTPTPFDTH